MRKINITLMAIATLFTFSGCLDGGSSGGEKITYDKTAEEVFTQKCSKCHGNNAEGMPTKKTPPMNDRQAGELELDLYDVKNGGLNQSSGTDHDVMEHNMQKLLAKGYNYDPKEMALYIEKNFYKKDAPAVTEEAPAE
ncbi:MAG: hypothetical protein K0U38_09145 [Epsilonproteobacteria bacterium]|nr:hypothetical protein [Campylobacterota bacterium]